VTKLEKKLFDIAWNYLKDYDSVCPDVGMGWPDEHFRAVVCQKAGMTDEETKEFLSLSTVRTARWISIST